MAIIKSYVRTITQERAIEIASKIYKIADDENISYEDLCYAQLFLEDMMRHNRDTSVDAMHRQVIDEIRSGRKVSLVIAVISLIVAVIALVL